MSYLDQLKDLLAAEGADPFEGFEGAGGRRIPEGAGAFEGFEGDGGGPVRPETASKAPAAPVSISKNKQTSKNYCTEPSKKGGVKQGTTAQTRLPTEPSKPSKGVEQGGNLALVIGPEQVRAGVDRELRLLAEKGRAGEQAMRDAIAITRAKIRNSPALAQDQPDTSRCLICGGREDGDNPFLPFLSGTPNRPNWLHFGCHPEHVRLQSAKVDALMTAAGYGQEAKGVAA